jgi:putative copper export protein
MRIRASVIGLAACAFALLWVAPAIAGEGGSGLYGKTDDKVITNFGFGLILFFTLLVCLLSAAQHLLERRKRSK